MANNRREFIKMTGILGAASLLPFGKLMADAEEIKKSITCTLIPSETAGPFPLDLTSNSFYFRQDVRESKAGVQLNLKMKIIGEGNCLPMQNVRVNIWHCDKDGLYSGYGAETGLTYLRGYQITDANGEVEFITIFPGWYPGRICHIHFQVYVSSSYAAISQLTFDIPTKQAIYTANPTIYTNGIDPVSLTADNIFADGYVHHMATLTPNTTTNGYNSYLEVTVQGNGVTGLGHLEKENAKQFTLGQNFPNPYNNETNIPLRLIHDSDLSLDLYDLQGKKLANIQKNGLSAGEHMISLNMEALGLATANYIYQLTVKNSKGTFIDSKMMSAGQ